MIPVFKPLEVPKRSYLPQDFTITTWEALAPYVQQLIDFQFTTMDSFSQWLSHLSELEAVISEDACWRQIKMTCNTQDPSLEEAYTYFVMEIEPPLKPLAFELQKKLDQSPFKNELDTAIYFPYLRGVANAIALYKEENIAIQADINVLAQQYGATASKMTIHFQEKEYTLQQAAKFLQSSEAAIRNEVFQLISSRRLEDQQVLNDLFNQLITKRNQIALNAGFENYRDYKFKELGRFDYSVKDCFEFHEAVKEYIVPIQKKLLQHKKSLLQIQGPLRPWDTSATPQGQKALSPFTDGKDLAAKAIQVFEKLNPYFSSCIASMQSMGRLDLDSRKGKAPGGYNCPLAETGVPFIFMNAAGTHGDVITMMHEGGHAFHSFLSHPLALSAFKEYPMEIAELASMSMELFSLEHWDVFYENKEELKRAQLEELERIIDVLPWIATIDSFQHWLYTNPSHTEEERTQAWIATLDKFSTQEVDWSGLESIRAASWQKQLHLFEVPFYYIEYGIAQLGALAMWRQYKQNKEQALANYCNALSLGYTKSLKELYQIAGIQFDFSPAYIKELAAFVTAAIEEML